jgi:hypothetical protein
MVITVGRAVVTTGRAVVTRRAVIDGLLNHVRGLVINRRRWRRIVDRGGRIDRLLLYVNGPWTGVGNRCADNATDHCTYNRRSTPAWAAATAVGLSLARKGQGT